MRGHTQFVGVDVDEPVRLQALRELLLASELGAQAEAPVARQGLYPDQILCESPFGDGDRLIRRFVVDEIDGNAVRGKVVQTAADEALLVVGLQDRDDLHLGIIL